MKHLKNKDELAEYLSLGTRIVNERFGPLRGANGNARLLGPCGDTMEFWVYVESGIIREAQYTTDGCYHSNKCGAAAAEMALGKSTEDAECFSQDEVLAAAGDIAEESSHCGLLAANALRSAIADWRRNGGNGKDSSGDKREIAVQFPIKPQDDLILSFRTKAGGEKTAAALFAGTFSDVPPMIIVSVDPGSGLTGTIKEAGSFALNFGTWNRKEDLKYLASKSLINRIAAKTAEGLKIRAPILADCPVNVECTVAFSITTGSAELIVARVECVQAEAYIIREDGTVDWGKMENQG